MPRSVGENWTPCLGHKKGEFFGYLGLIPASTALMSWVSKSDQKRIRACGRHLFDTRFSIQRLKLCLEFDASEESSSKRKVDLEYDCSNCRVGKYTIASHELLITRPMGVHCESEKKVGEPN
jgi:hypothetical protein